MTTTLWRRLPALLLILLPGIACLSAFSIWQAMNLLASDLEAQLRDPLSKAITEAGVNLPKQQPLNAFLVPRINSDLAALKPQRALGPIHSCRATVLQLRGEPFPTKTQIDRHILLNWIEGEQPKSLTLGLSCNIAWPTAIGIPLGLGTLALLIGICLLPPLPAGQQRVFESLIASGYEHSDALRHSQQWALLRPGQQHALDQLLDKPAIDPLDALQQITAHPFTRPGAQNWLTTALAVEDIDLAGALKIANAKDELVFYPQQYCVQVHGLSIPLPSTPFLYYLWYAQRKLACSDDDSWFVNPPSNNPDRHNAEELVALMESHGGHPKAINDLRDKGLRAKTLDQNRSKIKEELTQLLGEDLAAPYLFDVERDHKTARFKYRLSTPAARIRIVGDGAEGRTI